MFHEYWNITKLERYQPSISRINSGQKVTRKKKYVFYREYPLSSLFKWDVASAATFIFLTKKGTAIFSRAISLWLFSFLTIFIMYHEYWNITKLERYKPSLSRINSGKKVTKKQKDVFYRDSPLLSLFKKDVA